MMQRLMVVLAALTAIPAWVLAQANPGKEILDARLEGYSQNVTLPEGSTALTWLLFILLSIVCLSVLFINARRTHLD